MVDYVNIDYVSYTLYESGGTLTKRDSSYKYSNDGYLPHQGSGQLISGLEERSIQCVQAVRDKQSCRQKWGI